MGCADSTSNGEGPNHVQPISSHGTFAGASLPFPAFAGGAKEESWKASFTEQLSGPVREQSTSGGPYGYINSYDGDFKWLGKPTSLAIASEYVFCCASCSTAAACSWRMENGSRWTG